MRLLFAVRCPQLHDRRPGGGEPDQDRLPVGALGRHLGLCREDQFGPWSLVAILTAGRRPEERQRCQPDSEVWRDGSAQRGELGSLPMAMQNEEVATAAQRDRTRGGGHADAW